jgi:hypothetical protein
MLCDRLKLETPKPVEVLVLFPNDEKVLALKSRSDICAWF